MPVLVNETPINKVALRKWLDHLGDGPVFPEDDERLEPEIIGEEMKVYIVIDTSADGSIEGVFESHEDAEKCKKKQFDPSYIIIEEHSVFIVERKDASKKIRK